MTRKITKKRDKRDFLDLKIDDQVLLINEALSEQVYPALEMDGGGMEIMDIEGTNVLIRYYGACGNCPIAESGTLVFIQNTLREKVDPRIEVRIV
ncbi:NifU family protein [Candidatus Peregrinibacteria bacterium]|nr:NifU family protein [Candidatus Peregrinibacteria bacterium]